MTTWTSTNSAVTWVSQDDTSIIFEVVTQLGATTGGGAPSGAAGGGLGGTYPNPTVNYGTGGSTAAAGNDARLSDARIPTAHAGTHNTGGSDPLTALAAGVITSGTVAAARLGSGASATTFLRGDQTFAVPPAATTGSASATPKPSILAVRDYTIPGVNATAQSTVTPTANRPIIQLFTVERETVFDRAGHEVTTAAAAGKFGRFAIYTADTYWQPETLVYDSGNFAVDALGLVAVTCALTLPAGNYVALTIAEGGTWRTVQASLPGGFASLLLSGTTLHRSPSTLTARAGYFTTGFPALASTDTLVWDRDVGTSTSTARDYVFKLREVV